MWQVYNVALSALLIPLVDASVRRPSSARDRALGGSSYALYLVHWGLLLLYAAAFGEAPLPVKSLGLLGYVVAAGLSASLLYRYVDRPLESLRRRWLETLRERSAWPTRTANNSSNTAA